MQRLFFSLVLSAACAFTAQAQQTPPRDNPYDVIGKVLRPFWSVLLSDTQSPNKACTMTIQMTEVSGRLPAQMKGATLQAEVQFPDKVRLEAPVLGEQMIVCRNGKKMWAVPGQKVEFLLNQFKIKPPPTRKNNTPLYLPISPQLAVFLPAIFSVSRADIAEVDNLNGEEVRVITAGLMPDLAKATRSEGFLAQIYVAPGYVPRRFVITQPDFTATVDVTNLKFLPSLPDSTWQPPEGATDIYRAHADMLDAALFVVMNSIKMKEGDQPWLHAK